MFIWEGPADVRIEDFRIINAIKIIFNYIS